MDKFTNAAPMKQADIRIRESKNNLMFEKYMHRNSNRVAQVSQVGPSNDGADGSVKFGALPSLRNSPDPMTKKAKKHQGFPGSGTANKSAAGSRLGVAATNLNNNRVMQEAAAALDDSDFDFWKENDIYDNTIRDNLKETLESESLKMIWGKFGVCRL